MNMNVGCCKEEDFSPSGLYYTHIHLGANHLRVPDGMLAHWLSGSGAGDGDRDTNSRLRIAPVSACFFPRRPAVCCSFLGARAICAMVTVPACQLRHRFHLSSPPFASMMTQQLLQSFQPPPSSTSVIHHAHQTK